MKATARFNYPFKKPTDLPLNIEGTTVFFKGDVVRLGNLGIGTLPNKKRYDDWEWKEFERLIGREFYLDVSVDANIVVKGEFDDLYKDPTAYAASFRLKLMGVHNSCFDYFIVYEHQVILVKRPLRNWIKYFKFMITQKYPTNK